MTRTSNAEDPPPFAIRISSRQIDGQGSKFVRSSVLGVSLMLALMTTVQAQNARTSAPAPSASPQSADASKPAPTGLFVKFRVKPGKNAAFEAAFRQMQQSMRENEPGALYYDLFVTVEDPQLYVIMERYRDAAAVATHGQTEHLRKVLADLRELMDGPPQPQRLIFVSAK
jgi:quinol monooxygenase YgiN